MIYDNLKNKKNKLNNDQISLDLVKTILSGKIRLDYSVDADLTVNLTGEDINQAINSQIAKQWLSKIQFSTLKNTFGLQLYKAQLTQLNNEQISLNLKLFSNTTNYFNLIDVDLNLKIEKQKTVVLEKVNFIKENYLSLVQTSAVLNKITGILDTEKIKINNIEIWFKAIKIIEKQLQLDLKIYIPAA